jgi:hypothetical protein
VITHRCGTAIPADIETYVRHLASCPETHEEVGAWCQVIVNAVDHEAAKGETSRETAEARDLTPAEMDAMHRDGEGDSLRVIAAIAGVAPETVRRRIAKWKRGGA